MNTRAKGNQWENRVIDKLKARGLFITRSRCSEFPDHIAITQTGEVWFIEDKTTKYGFKKKEKEDLLMLKQKYKGRAFKAYPKYGPYSKKDDNLILEEL